MKEFQIEKKITILVLFVFSFFCFNSTCWSNDNYNIFDSKLILDQPSNKQEWIVSVSPEIWYIYDKIQYSNTNTDYKTGPLLGLSFYAEKQLQKHLATIYGGIRIGNFNYSLTRKEEEYSRDFAYAVNIKRYEFEINIRFLERKVNQIHDLPDELKYGRPYLKIGYNITSSTKLYNLQKCGLVWNVSNSREFEKEIIYSSITPGVGISVRLRQNWIFRSEMQLNFSYSTQEYLNSINLSYQYVHDYGLGFGFRSTMRYSFNENYFVQLGVRYQGLNKFTFQENVEENDVFGGFMQLGYMF